MKVSIVEDDKAVHELLKSYLEKWGKEKNVSFEISEFYDADTFLESYQRHDDLILMDIQLGKTNGMEASEKLRKIDKNVLIIFVTNLAHYAVDGYSVGAFDFVVKPLSYYNLALKLIRAKQHLDNLSKGEILISYKTGKSVIKIPQIKYIEVTNHILIYHTVDSNIRCSGSLNRAFEELKNHPFCLCNQCYLVNLKYVDSIKDNFVIIGDEKLLISKPKRKIFLQTLAKFLASEK